MGLKRGGWRCEHEIECRGAMQEGFERWGGKKRRHLLLKDPLLGQLLLLCQRGGGGSGVLRCRRDGRRVELRASFAPLRRPRAMPPRASIAAAAARAPPRRIAVAAARSPPVALVLSLRGAAVRAHRKQTLAHRAAHAARDTRPLSQTTEHVNAHRYQPSRQWRASARGGYGGEEGQVRKEGGLGG